MTSPLLRPPATGSARRTPRLDRRDSRPDEVLRIAGGARRIVAPADRCDLRIGCRDGEPGLLATVQDFGVGLGARLVEWEDRVSVAIRFDRREDRILQRSLPPPSGSLRTPAKSSAKVTAVIETSSSSDSSHSTTRTSGSRRSSSEEDLSHNRRPSQGRSQRSAQQHRSHVEAELHRSPHRGISSVVVGTLRLVSESHRPLPTQWRGPERLGPRVYGPEDRGWLVGHAWAAARSSRIWLLVGTRPTETTFSLMTSPGVLMTP